MAYHKKEIDYFAFKLIPLIVTATLFWLDEAVLFRDIVSANAE